MTDKTPGSRISSANLLRKITGAGVILFVILVTSFSFQNCVPSDDKGFSVQPSAPQFVEDFSEPGDLPRTCYAGTVSLVRSCLSSIISGGADHLKIHRMITCSTVNECRFDLKPLGQRVIKTVIYGSKRTTTGFTRTANFNYPILNLQDVSNFEVRNLKFDDTPVDGTSTDGMINVIGASNITITNCKFYDPKFAAVANHSISKVTIANSEIKRSRLYGIWIMETRPADEVKVLNNWIEESWANAILYSGLNGLISNNEFVNNHSREPFGYSGGQVLIEANTRNTKISCNNIRDGFLPGANVSSGIEFANYQIYDVDIRDNSIENNDGYAAYINHDNVDTGRIRIFNNYHQGNWVSLRTNTEFDYLGGYTPEIYSNCTTSRSCVGACSPVGPQPN